MTRRSATLDNNSEIRVKCLFHCVCWSGVGPGWGKLPGLDETRRDSVGPFSIFLMQRLVFHNPSRVSISLAGARLLAEDGGDIANLAYPLPGTEGSNPSLSAKILSLEVLGS